MKSNILVMFLLYLVPPNNAYSTIQNSLKYSSMFPQTTPIPVEYTDDDIFTRTSHSNDLPDNLSTLNLKEVTNTQLVGSTRRKTVRAMGRNGPAPGGSGGLPGRDAAITIIMEGNKVTDAPVQPGKLTIPPLPPGPTTVRPTTTPITSSLMPTSSSSSDPSSLYSSGTGHTTIATTTTDSPGSGGLSTMAAFMVGLGLGIGAFLIVGVLALVLYCKYMQRKTNDYRLPDVGNGSVREPGQYMQLSAPVSPTPTNFISGTMENRTYHTYEEARPSISELPFSPPVPSRVPATRYSMAPGEGEIIISTDGYAAYRPSVSSEQAIEDNPIGMAREMGSQHSLVFFLDVDTSSTRPRSATVPARGYEDLKINAAKRPTVIGQDGYAEYIDDGRTTKPKSYTQLKNSRPDNERAQTIGGYTRNKRSGKPSNYTDLTTGEKESDGYAKYNASVHTQHSSYTDLRTGQSRRLPATPPDENDIKGIFQRHASVGSMCSLGTINEDDTDVVSNEVCMTRTRGRIQSSDSDDSTYTNPNCDVESLSYEEVRPGMGSLGSLRASTGNTTPGLYLDLDDFYEGDECKLESDLCIDPESEDKKCFRFHKTMESRPYYCRVGDPYYASSDIENTNNEVKCESSKEQSQNEYPESDECKLESDLCVFPETEDRHYFKFHKTQESSPYYFKVSDRRPESARTEDNNNEAESTSAKDKSEDDQSENPYYFRVGSLRNKPIHAINPTTDSKKRSLSEPAYFQLVKTAGISENTCSKNDDKVCSINGADNQSEFVEAKYRRKTSLPLPNEMNTDYQHLVRALTLPPIVEAQTYQLLNRDLKK